VVIVVLASQPKRGITSTAVALLQTSEGINKKEIIQMAFRVDEGIKIEDP